jgi:hypothetical protein
MDPHGPSNLAAAANCHLHHPGSRNQPLSSRRREIRGAHAARERVRDKGPSVRRRDGGAGLAPLSPDPDVVHANEQRVALLRALLGSLRPRERDAALLDLQQSEPDHIAEKLRPARPSSL